MITSVIVMTTVVYKALILHGEIWCRSLVGLKGLTCYFFVERWMSGLKERKVTFAPYCAVYISFCGMVKRDGSPVACTTW